MRLVAATLVAGALACAHRTSNPPTTVAPEGDARIYDLPYELALAEARAFLESQHIHVHATRNPLVLVSNVREWSTDEGMFGGPQPTGQLGEPVDKGLRNRIRQRTQWMVVARPMGPRRTSISIFQSSESDFEAAGGGWVGKDRQYSPEAVATDAETLARARSVLELPARAAPARAPTLESELAQHVDALPSVETSMENPPEGEGVLALGFEGATPGADACEPELPVDTADVDAFFAPGHVLMLGDRLGTSEVPRAFSAVACAALARHLAVLVALDLPESQQASLNGYLSSDGGPWARLRLLVGPFWRNPYPDGVSSEAMLQLLERVRQWRRAGAAVTVVAYGNGLRGNEREASAAARISEERSLFPKAFTLVLGGNVHLSRKAGAEWDPGFIPLGHRVARDAPDVLALDLAFDEGTHWGCTLLSDSQIDCGVTSLKPGPLQTQLVPETARGAPFIRRISAMSPHGFDGVWYVGAVSASPPAHRH